VYRTGKPYSGKGVRIMLQVEPAGGLEERIVDFTYQPLFGDDGAVSGLLAHGIDLTERVLLEEERERLLAESRARADREILLNRIGIEARRTMEPDSILQAAISALGEGLGADRCYFVRYDQTRDTARVFPEWYRDGTVIEPLTGRIFQMSSLSVDRDPGYKTGNTHVVNDVVAYSPDDAAPFVALQIRAILRVPIEVGDQMTALAVAMAMEPREWTEGEIRLVENVASLVRSTLESAHLQQRERNIAQQLQAALQPDPPADLPGVALASYYRPALQEAGVGGDAFDVFSIKDGCTALCVFDLSGKGLRAAAAVATVRNSVRFAVYNGLTISAALTNVNRTLVEHGLIDGFATLFLGVYDERCRSLTYVNCGQEPGLIRRAGSAEIELLMPTGPVLGGFIEGVFTERTVAVDPGDILAIFTDGLTEVGATRQNLLGIEGVSEILQASCDAATEICDPKLIITRLIEGVDAFAADGVRDDIAVLIGVFEQ
jgi:serine phosphatase RsbU (regulator of sigma subunit)